DCGIRHLQPPERDAGPRRRHRRYDQRGLQGPLWCAFNRSEERIRPHRRSGHGRLRAWLDPRLKVELRPGQRNAVVHRGHFDDAASAREGERAMTKTAWRSLYGGTMLLFLALAAPA